MNNYQYPNFQKEQNISFIEDENETWTKKSTFPGKVGSWPGKYGYLSAAFTVKEFQYHLSL